MVMGQQWLWPALVVATMLGRCWATGCPSNCLCQRQHDQLIADCPTLPTYGGEIVNLTISHTDTELELLDGSFNSFKHLKYLTLRNTSIYEVQNKTFYGANKIEKIDLAFNNITKLDATVFKDLNNLTSVSLRGNPIVLEQESPFLVSNSITHLDIGECQIDKIPEGVFYELKRLTHLTLDGNSIQSIEINVLPKGLQYLDLSNNTIKNVQTEVFFSLPNLKQLNLIGNPINCSCSLMKLIASYKHSDDIILEDAFNCTLSQKSKELCLNDTEKEYKHDENTQADQPVSEISNEKDFAHQTMGDDKENNENQDSTTVPSDSDENMSTSIATDSSMDVETTSDEPSNATSTTTTFSTRLEAADTNDIKLQNNVPETETNDKITDNDKNSLKATPDDNSESGTQVTETKDHTDANSNTNDTDNQILSSSSTMTIEFDTKASQEVDFQQDGLITNVDIEKIQAAEKNSNSSELFTNEDVEGSGQGLDNHFDDDNSTQGLTSTTETNNSPFNTKSQEEDEIETESSLKVTENVSEPELKDNLTSNAITENEHPETTESPTPGKTSENEQLSPVVGTTEFTPNNETETIQESIESRKHQDDKLQEMAGAQVVMFCVAILIICLVLFSIYKCRSSKNRQSMSNLKDIESNRGTELQDMASLLPKPEEKEEKKNNLKYEDKAPSSETVKLLSEPNENDSSNFTPVAETKTKLEDKNSLNNNTPSSKEPLIKPEKPVTINPAAPIQRTKVKVGIIPDSIPRTPIFVQKTYNGTKNV